VGKGFRKTDFYGVFPPPENPDIFTETREAVHAQKKRVAATPYSMAAMQQLSGFVDDTERLLTEKLDGFVGKGSCNLGDWLHYFAFDVSKNKQKELRRKLHLNMQNVFGNLRSRTPPLPNSYTDHFALSRS
jgi:hypothetical protein